MMDHLLAFAIGRPDRAPARYLIGVDGSGPGLAALRWGLRRAESLGADVVLAHVQEPADPADESAELLDAAVAVAARSHPSVQVTAKPAVGNVADELARLSLDCDLLIVGTHKTGYLRGRAIGSRSIFIASLARCSVAIVPDVSLVSRRGVVVGMDARSTSKAAFWHAASEAHRLRQPLILLSADEQPSAHPGERGFHDAEHDALRAAAKQAIQLVPDLEVHSRFSARPASEALLDASRGASLLVLDAATHPDLQRPIIGPVAHDVLMNITAPVLIARLAPTEPGGSSEPVSVSERTR